MSDINVYVKALNIIRSCKTYDQLRVALNYVTQAMRVKRLTNYQAAGLMVKIQECATLRGYKNVTE